MPRGRRGRLLDAVDGVVVAEREQLDAGRRGGARRPPRRQRAVGVSEWLCRSKVGVPSPRA